MQVRLVTECLRVERISAELRRGNECRPGRFLPDYVVYHTERDVMIAMGLQEIGAVDKRTVVRVCDCEGLFASATLLRQAVSRKNTL